MHNGWTRMPLTWLESRSFDLLLYLPSFLGRRVSWWQTRLLLIWFTGNCPCFMFFKLYFSHLILFPVPFPTPPNANRTSSFCAPVPTSNLQVSILALKLISVSIFHNNDLDMYDYYFNNIFDVLSKYPLESFFQAVCSKEYPRKLKLH